MTLIDPTRKQQPARKYLEGLTERQRMFIDLRVESPELSATEVCRRIGYKCPGQAAVSLMKKKKVRVAISAEINRRSRDMNLKAQELDWVLVHAVSNDVADVFDSSPDGTLTLKQLQKVPAHVRRTIQSVKVKKKRTRMGSEEVEIDIKFIDKLAAYELLARRHNWIETKPSDGQGVHVNLGFITSIREKLENDALQVEVIDMDAVRKEAAKRTKPDTIGTSLPWTKGQPPESEKVNDNESVVLDAKATPKKKKSIQEWASE